ncbi:MAG TPA: hypothetical protein VEL51_04660 [Vicinamibacterales bacterium]|nr:hypothetical protein [Vicinamibacterales bacterium]
MTLLHEWETFYVIVGSSSAALIGLQFVVIALIADIRSRTSPREIDAFASPTIVHFAVVLLLSGILTAPWRTPGAAAVLLGVSGLSGVVYTAIVVRRMIRQKGYRPVAEDWLFHAVLPAFGYALLAGAGLILGSNPENALFATGTTALLLMFTGIHNAWDTVTFVVAVRKPTDALPEQPAKADATPGTDAGVSASRAL